MASMFAACTVAMGAPLRRACSGTATVTSVACAFPWSRGGNPPACVRMRSNLDWDYAASVRVWRATCCVHTLRSSSASRSSSSARALSIPGLAGCGRIARSLRYGITIRKILCTMQYLATWLSLNSNPNVFRTSASSEATGKQIASRCRHRYLMCVRTTVATLELEFTPIDRDARNDRYQLAV